MTDFTPVGFIRTPSEHAQYRLVAEHFLAGGQYALHEPTGMLVLFVKTAAVKPGLWCVEVHTGKEHLLSGVLLKPLSEMEVVAHAAR